MRNSMGAGSRVLSRRACAGKPNPALIEFRIERLTLLLRQDHRQQIRWPRQAADMGGQDPLRAVLHERLRCCGESLALLALAVDGSASARTSGIVPQDFFDLREPPSRY